MNIKWIMYCFGDKQKMTMKDCKVIPREECLTQHRLLCADGLIRGMIEFGKMKERE